MNIQTFKLDNVARGYILEVLSKGRTFAACLAKHNNLSQGEVETYLPQDVPIEFINRFQWGGVFPGGKVISPTFYDGRGKALVMMSQDSHEQQLIVDVTRYLENNASTFAICENPIVDVDFPWLKTSRKKSRILIYEGEVINCVTSDEVTSGRVTNMIGEIGGLGPSPGLICALVQGDEQMMERWGKDWSYLSKEDLDEAAQCVQKIIIGAYDGESYLVWSKQLS